VCGHTFSLLSGGLVEGQPQGDDGGDLQDDEGDVLQGLPHQLQEGLGLLGGDEVLAEHRRALLQVGYVVRETLREGEENHKQNQTVSKRLKEDASLVGDITLKPGVSNSFGVEGHEPPNAT